MLQTLFEYETRNLELNQGDLALLERLNKAFASPALRPTFKNGKTAIQASQYVGVFRFGKRTVQVLPKIYREQDGENEKQHARDATSNLLYLLAASGQLPIHEHEIAPLLRAGQDWFEILTRLFATHLATQWQKGAHRYYQTVEDELPLLKGKWRIADQLRRTERKHLFAVAFDEFTADTQLNRVFRYVVERLWWLTRDAGNRQLLGTLRNWMDEVKLLPSISSDAAHPALITRLNARYEPLLNLARLFLSNNAVQLATGAESVFSFSFDMNVLFEAFIANFIRQHRHTLLPVELRNCELLPQSVGATRNLARLNGKPVFGLRPDLAFRQDKAFPLLLDTKYKRLDGAYASGVGLDDFTQMYVYAQRYNCPRVILLYPQTERMTKPLRVLFSIEGSEKQIMAATVDLRVRLDKVEGRHALADELRTILGGNYADW